MMMKSSRHEKDKNIECNIIRHVKNIFRLKNKTDDTTIKYRRNVMRLKEVDDTIVKDIRNLFGLKRQMKQLKIE